MAVGSAGSANSAGSAPGLSGASAGDNAQHTAGGAAPSTGGGAVMESQAGRLERGGAAGNGGAPTSVNHGRAYGGRSGEGLGGAGMGGDDGGAGMGGDDDAASAGRDQPVAGRGGTSGGGAGGGGNVGAAGSDTAPVLEAEWSGVLDAFSVHGTDVATVSRSSVTLDLFSVSADGGVNLYTFDQVWLPAQVLAAPSGVTFAAVAAVYVTPTLEVIASGPNHDLYFNYATVGGPGTPDFVGWSPLAGAATTGEQNSLALITTGDGELHAFWLTETGKVGHAWSGDGADWSQIESGDDEWAFYLRPTVRPSTLNAISPLLSRIDLVLDGSGWAGLQHLWYDAHAGSWGTPATPHIEQLYCAKLEPDPAPFVEALSGFALLRTGEGSFDVFVSEHAATAPTSVYHSSYSVNTGWIGSSTQAWFERFDVNIGGPSTIVDGLVWANEKRRDVFGVVAGSTSIWQAYYH